MPRSFESCDAHLPNLQMETVLDRHVREGRLGLRSDVDAGAGSCRQLSVSGDEVGMQVSFEDVANGNTIRLRGLQVNLHVTLRIDHNRFALGGQHVGGMRQTAQIKLFEVHRSPPLQTIRSFYRAGVETARIENLW